MSIKLLITSDLHGQFSQYSAIKSLSNNIKSKTSKTVINIDLGDFTQGSTTSYYYNNIANNSTIYSTAQNYLNIDYQVLGNHEFNRGRNHLEGIVTSLNAKILNANILDSQTNLPFLGQAFDIIELDDITIGIVGLTTAFIPHWEPRDNYQNLKFINPIEALEKQLKTFESQVDYIIVLYHGGIEGDLETFEFNDKTPGENQALEILTTFPQIDLLVTGHQHLTLNEKINNTVLIQPGSHGQYLYEVTIEKTEDGSFHMETMEHAIHSKEQPEFIQPQEQQSINAWAKEVVTVVPENTSLPNTHLQMSLYNHPFYELHNEVQRQVGQADFSLTPIASDAAKRFVGKMTNEQLLSIYPFYNKIATVRITGKELFDIMEYNLAVFTELEKQVTFNYDFTTTYKHHYHFFSFSGFECLANLDAPVYDRIQSLIDSRTNEEIISDKNYTLAVSIYHAVSDAEIPHLSEVKIIRLTEKDSFYYLQEKLKTMNTIDWEFIYQNYNHLTLKKPNQ